MHTQLIASLVTLVAALAFSCQPLSTPAEDSPTGTDPSIPARIHDGGSISPLGDASIADASGPAYAVNLSCAGIDGSEISCPLSARARSCKLDNGSKKYRCTGRDFLDASALFEKSDSEPDESKRHTFQYWEGASCERNTACRLPATLSADLPIKAVFSSGPRQIFPDMIDTIWGARLDDFWLAGDGNASACARWNFC